MLDLRHVADHLAEVRTALARRGPAAASSLDGIAARAESRRVLIVRLEALRAQKNEANAEMAKLDKQGDAFKARRDELKALAQQSKTIELELKVIEDELADELLLVPNLPAPEAPDGPDETANVELRLWGDKPGFDFEPKDHVAIATDLDVLDMERGAKISGARFAVLKGAGARLSRALMGFMLDLHTTEHGYTEVLPPALVTDQTLRGTGQLPKFAADLFRIAPDWQDGAVHDAPRRDLYLIPTAEVPLTNLHADEIIADEDMPIHYVAYTPCFRSEAGSYGKDTRGLIRVHQFDKVELVRFERADEGADALDKLTAHAEAVLQKLGLHYRVVDLCTGDMNPNAHRGYDLEVWLPSQDAYREISSCSWFGDYQARRAKIRYRPAGEKKARMAHTLNGSGLAIGRTIVAILEQNQQADGSVRVPTALVPYMGGVEVIR